MGCEEERMLFEKYMEIVEERIRRARTEQGEQVAAAARAIADCVERGGTLFAFGCGHSALLAQEIFYRAGGLMLVNPIFAPGTLLHERPVTITSRMERLSGLAGPVVEASGMRAGDVLLLFSTSGRNALPVEMGMEAQKRGVIVIALVSKRYCAAIPSRHESGKKVPDVADIVLDNEAEAGDAVLQVEGLPAKIGPVSGAVGAAMLHGVIVEAVGLLLKRGITPPVFVSGNLPEGDEHNKRLLQEHRDQIRYM
jgi:uncharacterized phosphosugar-binding protein